jgi:hypothetical protein
MRHPGGAYQNSAGTGGWHTGRKVATKLAYVLQVAMSNVGNVEFEPEEEEEEEQVR